VIQYINKTPRRFVSGEYKEFVEANADIAQQLSGMISDFVNYGNTKNRLEHLTNKLELPANSQ
jgi:hypothetical protein